MLELLELLPAVTPSYEDDLVELGDGYILPLDERDGDRLPGLTLLLR
ncbi:hypothetical protein AGMMS49936_11730 [Endomicrobiia bacterium]|nr:hypothetical protein AGMMS49936_11730 [Endomicrobiia bacterium]